MSRDVEKAPFRGNGEELEPQISRASERSRPGSRPRLRIQVPGEEGDNDTSHKETITPDTSARPAILAAQAGISKAASPRFARRLSSDSEKDERVLDNLKKLFGIPDSGWIKNNLDATHIKPVIRAAVAAWLSVLLLVIGPVQRMLGQVKDTSPQDCYKD